MKKFKNKKLIIGLSSIIATGSIIAPIACATTIQNNQVVNQTNSDALLNDNQNVDVLANQQAQAETGKTHINGIDPSSGNETDGTISITDSGLTGTDGFQNMFSTQMTPEMITTFVNENKMKVWANLPPDAEVVINPSSITYDVTAGSVSFNLDVTKYYAHAGAQVTDNTNQDLTKCEYWKLTLTGFLNMTNDDADFTTTIPKTIDIGESLTDKKMLPQQFNDEGREIIMDAIYKTLVNPNSGSCIQHLVNGQTVSDKLIAKKDIIISQGNSSFNNQNGTLLIRSIVINFGNDNVWVNGQSGQKVTQTDITISGFANIQPTVVNDAINTDGLSINGYNNQDSWTNTLASKFIEDANKDNYQTLIDFLNKNGSTIFNNWISNDSANNGAQNINQEKLSKVTRIESMEANNKDGTINVTFNATGIFLNDGSATYDYMSGNTFNIKLTGFASLQNNPTLFTTTLDNSSPIDGSAKLNNILADYLNNDLEGENKNDTNLNLVKDLIKSSNVIKNLANGIDPSTLDNSDIELVDINPNNAEGTITATVNILNNKAWTDGNIESSKSFNNVIISGFKKQAPTTSTVNSDVNIDGVNEILSICANSEILQQNKDNILNALKKIDPSINIPPNATIDSIAIANGSPTAEEAKSGKLKVNVYLDKIYAADNANLVDNTIGEKKAIQVTLTGFKSGDGVTTGLIDQGKVINLSNETQINGLLPYDIANKVNNAQNTFIDAFKTYLVDHASEIFTSLNPNHPLQPTDITVNIDSSSSNPINKDGTMSVVVAISKDALLDNGFTPSRDQQFTLNIGGLKTQAPTVWNNLTDPNSSSGTVDTLVGADTINIDDVIAKQNDIQTLINNNDNLAKFVSNLPADVTLTIKSIDKTKIDLPKGTIQCEISVNKTFDDNGNPTNEEVNKIYTIGGFKPNTNTTTISNVTLNNPDQIASDAIANSDQTSLINAIKEQLVNGGAISNIYPLNDNTIQSSDLDVQIIDNSANNLDGTIKVNVTINNNFYMKNGVVQPSSDPIEVTVGGFKKLTPTTVNDNAINSIDKNQTAQEAANNPNFTSDIAKDIQSSLTPDMFPDGQVPTADQIKVEIVGSPDDNNGTITIRVSFPNKTVNSDGTINDQPFSKEFTISNFKTINNDSNNGSNNNTSSSGSVNPWWMWVILSGFLIPLILIFILGAIEQKRKNKDSQQVKIDQINN